MADAPYKVKGNDNGCEVRELPDGTIIKVPWSEITREPAKEPAKPKGKAKGDDKTK